MGTFNVQIYWKCLKSKGKNHTKIAKSENKQKSKTPSLISQWLVGRKGKIGEKSSILQCNTK